MAPGRPAPPAPGGRAGSGEPTASGFRAAFAGPTAAQAQAWKAIGNGENALVIAPTGSGKTLAAFLWAIDKLATEPIPDQASRRCRVLYISPLKALAVDIERNLRSPLTGVGQAMRRLGLPEPDIRVGIRTGDTAADERRKLAGKPPDILITTPESLFLLLTSRARDGLRSVETVIIDEVHALAGGKRGAHLALSLERLDALRGAGRVRPPSPVHPRLAGDPRLPAAAPAHAAMVARVDSRPAPARSQRSSGTTSRSQATTWRYSSSLSNAASPVDPAARMPSTPTSSSAAPISPAGKSSASPSPGRCSPSPRC